MDQAGIDVLRTEIDEIDTQLVQLILRRTAVSHAIGAARRSLGGPRIVYSREMAVLQRFRDLGPAGTVAVGGRSNRLVMTGTTLPGGTDSAVTCSSARRTLDRPDRGQPLLTGCTMADRCGLLLVCLSLRALAVHTHSESFSTGTGSRCPFAAETPATTTPRGPHRPGAFFVPGSSGPRQNEDAKRPPP